ncbi:MAG TPA: DNA-processing protein DprA [Burkholderiales bacterium]|nr:DNA-processing protein DprA [Burkholderiales bacterium]
MDEVNPWLMLARAPGLHAGLLPEGELRADPTALGRESRAALTALGLPPGAIAALRQPDPAALAADERWLAAANRTLVGYGTPAYPPLLAAIEDAPLVLFVEGDADALGLPQLAMVGARNPTAIGRDTAAQFAEHLARAGLAITSGLALGIDAASHRGALAGGGRTIAVQGCGPDRVYPAEHTALAREIAAHGALVSEFPTGVPPLPEHFPRRNRIISGLAVGTLVVEAALASGSLITARRAGEQGREVFAIPGSIHSPLSRGCHRLIRDGAKLVESADDIFTELGALLGGLRPGKERSETSEQQAESGRRLDKEYEILLDALGFEPAGIDALVSRTGLKTDAVASMLLILELEGWVEQQRGGVFCRRLPGKQR